MTNGEYRSNQPHTMVELFYHNPSCSATSIVYHFIVPFLLRPGKPSKYQGFKSKAVLLSISESLLEVSKKNGADVFGIYSWAVVAPCSFCRSFRSPVAYRCPNKFCNFIGQSLVLLNFQQTKRKIVTLSTTLGINRINFTCLLSMGVTYMLYYNIWF